MRREKEGKKLRFVGLPGLLGPPLLLLGSEPLITESEEEGLIFSSMTLFLFVEVNGDPGNLLVVLPLAVFLGDGAAFGELTWARVLFDNRFCGLPNRFLK